MIYSLEPFMLSSFSELCSVILLFETCVFVCVCTSIGAGNEEEAEKTSIATYAFIIIQNINSVVGCFHACADNNQLLNYISIWIISFWCCFLKSIMTGFKNVGIRFLLVSSIHSVLMPMQSICQVLGNCHFKIEN